MQYALDMAKIAFQNGEVPVGCIITKDRKIISQTYNLVEKNSNVLHHAEILAIREATKMLNSKYLTNCNMYVTLEPCYMCAGAISHAKIQRLYIGAENKRFGAIMNGSRIYSNGNLNYIPEWYSGFLEKESSELLTKFFENK